MRWSRRRADARSRRRRDEIAPDVPVGPLGFADAIMLLRLHQNRVHGVGKPLRWKRPRTLDEVRCSILKKLEAIEGARAYEVRLAAGDASGVGPDGKPL